MPQRDAAFDKLTNIQYAGGRPLTDTCLGHRRSPKVIEEQVA